MWMVRAGRGGENIDDFIAARVVASGDPKVDALSTSVTNDALRREVPRREEAKASD